MKHAAENDYSSDPDFLVDRNRTQPRTTHD